jgi:23S rRNA pseudouridine2605 synthase
MEERLQKIIAQSGAASRRRAERLIMEGRVTINGEVVRQLGIKADPEKDRIELDGQFVNIVHERHYYILNKPAGYITTLSDPQGRPIVADLFQGLPERVFPVGRLDQDAEGLLLLTNDGELAKRLMHPRYHVTKTYRVKVEGHPSSAALSRLRKGEIMLGDRQAAPADVAIAKKGDDRTWLIMTIIEGRHHQVKRMCSQVGHPVMKLKRVAYGPVKLGRLPNGQLRPLRDDEVLALKKSAGLRS